MAINKKLIDTLNSKNYQLALSGLKSLIVKNRLSKNDVLTILNLNNKLIIDDFFRLQSSFSESTLLITEKFVNENLNHRNKLFVSDLIEIAIDFNLNLNYNNCIKLLDKNKGDNQYVLLSIIDYIVLNLKSNYISEILNRFEIILNNKKNSSSVRIKVVFYLYRITFNKKYLIKLSHLVKNDNYNIDLVKNILKEKLNEQKHFADHKTILNILNV